MKHLLALLAMPTLLAGCTELKERPRIAITPEPALNGPRKVSFASFAGDQVSRDEHQLFEVELEGWGRVRGTKQVLASFQDQLRSEPGRNRTVESCGAQLERAAAVHGPVRVETASMGPERRMPGGLYEGTVEVRITYSRGNLHEIRQATMICTARPDGTVVDMKAVSPLKDSAKD